MQRHENLDKFVFRGLGFWDIANIVDTNRVLNHKGFYLLFLKKQRFPICFKEYLPYFHY